MTAHPPSDAELREWRVKAVTENIYKGASEPWTPLVIAINALLAERAEHAATKAAAIALCEALNDPWPGYTPLSRAAQEAFDALEAALVPSPGSETE